MRILITNVTLKERSGTGMATRDLALGFLGSGHEPCVFSPELGVISDEILKSGVRVIGDLGELTSAPDIIHGNHYAETVKALIRFPETPAVFVLHDPSAWHSVPPLSPQIRRYVAVDYNCHARLTDRYQIPESRIRVIFNAYDPARFQMRKHPSTSVSRALVFSNYASPGGFVEHIREACTELGIPLDIIGSGMNQTHPNPGEILHQYDLVFAIGRSAVEASATGAAVITCGSPGLGPFTTRANIMQLFARDYPYVPFTKELVIAEIKKVNFKEAHDLSEYVQETHPLPLAVGKYLALYQEALADSTPASPDPLGAMLDATAQRFQKMESLARVLPGSEFSARLPCSISKKLSLRILSAPDAATEPFVADVEVENRSAETLSPNPPYPINISYRWISSTGKIVVHEGRRTPLPAPLKPGDKQQCRIRVDLPPNSGDYRLRATLVQEQVMWLDDLKPPVASEIRIAVKNRPPAGER